MDGQRVVTYDGDLGRYDSGKATIVCVTPPPRRVYSTIESHGSI
jgi:hypothetical protein